MLPAGVSDSSEGRQALRRVMFFPVALLFLVVLSGVVMRYAPSAELPKAEPEPAVSAPAADQSLKASVDPNPSEPNNEDCVAAVEGARALAAPLPTDDLSRYFAERHLQQAMTEAGNGEFDDCVYWAQRAKEEVGNQQHKLQPGETLKVLRADEQPLRPEPSPPASEKRTSSKRSQHKPQ
jgi:hypothetical protein